MVHLPHARLVYLEPLAKLSLESFNRFWKTAAVDRPKKSASKVGRVPDGIHQYKVPVRSQHPLDFQQSTTQLVVRQVM